MGLLDFLFGNKKEQERIRKERLAEQERIKAAEEARIATERKKRLEENRKKREEERDRRKAALNNSPIHSSLITDVRSVFYNLQDIKSMSMGPGWMLAPYDAHWFFSVPDASLLPAIANTDKIKRFLPGLGFTDEDSCKKRLEGYLLKAESQMGITYVIRNQNLPMGMIFVNSPLYNKTTINTAIWTVDFYISEIAEHQGIMFNSLARVLNVMKTVMGVKAVYALVDENNAECIHLLENWFTNVDNSGFAKTAEGGKKPLAYMLNLSEMRFEKI